MRRSLLTPIPELKLASKLLDSATDALLLGRLELASFLLAQSDIKEIMDYTIKIIGPLSLEVHRQIKRPSTLPREQRDPARMPGQSIQEEIFQRDGWHCRFCETPVISRKARNVLVKIFPSETRWQNKDYERHSALYSMAASLDHVVPHSRGGRNEVENFVTVCYCCQFGRGEWTLEESDLMDPRQFSPIVDAWDGLSRLEGFDLQY